MAQNGINLDELAAEHLQQLEALVTEYKGTVQELQRELDARSANGSVMGGTASLHRLQEELEDERASKAELEAGTSHPLNLNTRASPLTKMAFSPEGGRADLDRARRAHRDP